MKKKRGLSAWYGFDLDGTLAHHESGDSIAHIGEPIARNVQLARRLLAAGHEVRIVTARVSPEWNDREEQIAMIKAWCKEHLGQELEVQAHKNGGMLNLWDDRAIGVERNTGVPHHEAVIQRAYDHAPARIREAFFERTGLRMEPSLAEAIADRIFNHPSVYDIQTP